MKNSERNKLRFYKTEVCRLENKIIKMENPDEGLHNEVNYWKLKYRQSEVDNNTISEVISEQNKQIIDQKILIADQTVTINNLEKGLKEIDTGRGILSIIFKGSKK